MSTTSIWGRHPHRESLVRYVRDELPLPQRRKVGKHISSCLLCQRKAHKISVESSQELEGFGYEAAIKRAAEGTREWLNRFHEESRPATSFLNTLLESESRDLRRLHEDPQAHTLKLCQLLQDRCRFAWLQEPVKAVEFAHLAASVADHLDESRYGTGLVADARAQAWTDLGNSYRILSDLGNAEQALRTAAEHQKLSGDPFTEIEVLSTLASLRRIQGRFDESTTLLDRAIGIAREGEDRHREGRALITKGTALGDKALGTRGDFQLGIRLLRKGITRIDAAVDPDLMLAAQHNVIVLLNESGKAYEAKEALKHGRHLYRDLGKQVQLARLHWLEGQIAEELNFLDEAQASLQNARELILEHRVPLDLGFVSLDLSLVLFKKGRRNEAKRLVKEVIPIFDAVGTYPDAIAARLLFFRLS